MSDIRQHFDSMAGDYDKLKGKNWYYLKSLKEFYKKAIQENSTVLEIGCATGEILNSVNPKKGVGLDISEKMIEVAKNKFPYFEFLACPIESYAGKDKFNYIIMCDLLDHVPDIESLFKNTDKVVEAGSQIIITTINPLWDKLLEIAARLKLKIPEGTNHFVFKSKVIKLFESFSYKVESEGYFLLIPFYIPVISEAINRYLAGAPFLKNLCFVQYIIAVKKKLV
jgi:ubiquinone/menaquinone biosynthesis C-methylase UbiE